ncbi:MAG: sodium:alanine symporter family protein [Parvularculaceae bacterium]
MDAITSLIGTVNGFVWGVPMLALLLGTGLYLTIGLGFMPILRIPYAFGQLVRGGKRHSGEDGDVSPFGALMTALSSTVGTGNIAGVAVAIAIGGPGALFWMWMTALVGMATKYAEGVLAVKFREIDADGRHVGGPMYYIKNGLGRSWVWLGGLFAIFGIFASLGTGNYIQVVSVADAMHSSYGVPIWVSGVVMMVLAGAVILGGIQRIASVAGKLVPAMASFYFIAGVIVIGLNIDAVPAAFSLVFQRAFGFDAAAGGFSGALLMLAMQRGVARGIFSNEAGQGSAPIAHAAAKNKDPVNQGVIAMLGTFIDTIVICSITGIAILTAGVIPAECNAVSILANDVMPAVCDTGPPITIAAFEASLPGIGGHVVTISLALFAFTTVLGWSYYGERCAEYLFSEKAVLPYRILYVGVVLAAALVLYTGDNMDALINTIWLATDTLTGLMAAPNLVALLGLSPLVFRMTREYFEQEKRK